MSKKETKLSLGSYHSWYKQIPHLVLVNTIYGTSEYQIWYSHKGVLVEHVCGGLGFRTHCFRSISGKVGSLDIPSPKLGKEFRNMEAFYPINGAAEAVKRHE